MYSDSRSRFGVRLSIPNKVPSVTLQHIKLMSVSRSPNGTHQQDSTSRIFEPFSLIEVAGVQWNRANCSSSWSPYWNRCRILVQRERFRSAMARQRWQTSRDDSRVWPFKCVKICSQSSGGRSNSKSGIGSP
uniref:(northern house mosquito) hypothetical protein n=1 Tax=Culex pipiens TaxID=7175 RepID=A0A8D8CU53_CULPI